MSETLSLGHDTVDLALTIAETPAMAISSVVVRDFHPKDGAALIAAGALKSDGFEAVSTSLADHDDAPVNLIWSSETGGYAYFSPAVGLVRVDDDALLNYRLDISWLLHWISRQLGFTPGVRQVCLIPDQLWDLGDIWLGEGKRKQRKTAVYLARRLNELESVKQVVELLRMHSDRPGKLILTTTHDPNLARAITYNFAAVLPIKSCAQAGVEDFVLDALIIHSAVHGLRQSATASPVRSDAEFRVIQVGDREFHFRGDKQRQVVGFLYKRSENQEGRISAAIMFEELGLTGTNRLRDLFKGHPDWRDLIGYKDGACWLRCDELLSGLGIPRD
jgi:hypothetical protein